ncbi:MAG: hypothetical protein ACR2LR_13420 [Hassallia sp.]
MCNSKREECQKFAYTILDNANFLNALSNSWRVSGYTKRNQKFLLDAFL